MTEPLLTIDDLEWFRGRDSDPTLMLRAAGQAVRSYCGWHIAPVATETVTVEGSGATLLLPTLRLGSVTSIERDDVAIPLDTIRWKPNGIVRGYAFGSAEYDVTFTHGYAETPSDIAQAVASLASEGIDGVRRLKSWTKGPFSESFHATAFDGERATLDRYRIVARP